MKERFTDTLAWLIVALGIVLSLILALQANAQWEEVPEHGTTLDLGGMADNKVQAFTGQALHAAEIGWIGLQATHVQADGETLSEDVNGRIQGDFGYLQVFGEVSRDMSSELKTDVGAYIRYILETKHLDFTVGAGNFLAREEVKAELGFEETDPTTLSYWLGSVGTSYSLHENINLYGQVIATPEARFKHWRGTVHFGLDIVISDRVTMKIQNQNDFSTEGETTEVQTQNSLIVSLNL